MSASPEIQERLKTSTLPAAGYARLRISCWSVLLALGAAQAWATRFTMNPDGISYLDIGDAYWRGDWHNAINAYWSPLYSWILGFFLKMVRPSAYWEYPLVHLVNFFIYVAALGCFEFFLATFIAQQTKQDERLSALNEIGFPEWAWWVLGYSVFVSCSLTLITMQLVTPDMCVAAFVFLASALVWKVHSGAATRKTYTALGVVLGFAYLAKAVMLPLGLVFLATAMLAGRLSQNSLRNIMRTTLVMLAVASPFIAAISHARGRVTFGESGALTYAAYLNGVDPWFPGDSGKFVPQGIGSVEDVDTWSPNTAMLKHPPRRIFDLPAAWEFAQPVVGTYPFWYDPSYWQDGIKPRFNITGEIAALKFALLTYLFLLGNIFLQLNLSVAIFMLYMVAPRPAACLKRAAENWPLLAIGILGIGLYGLVHTEFRYVSAFTTLLFLAVFSGVHLPLSSGIKKYIASLVIGISTTTMLTVTWNIATLARQPAAAYWQVGRALIQAGIKPGDKIAMISADPWGMGGPFVARLARVQIIAQVNRPDVFWTAAPLTQSQVLYALHNTGAKAVLAWGGVPLTSGKMGWHEMGASYYLHLAEDHAVGDNAAR